MDPIGRSLKTPAIGLMGRWQMIHRRDYSVGKSPLFGFRLNTHAHIVRRSAHAVRTDEHPAAAAVAADMGHTAVRAAAPLQERALRMHLDLHQETSSTALVLPSALLPVLMT
eukprot:3060554-Pyramimonas_sp.AAC.2